MAVAFVARDFILTLSPIVAGLWDAVVLVEVAVLASEAHSTVTFILPDFIYTHSSVLARFRGTFVCVDFALLTLPACNDNIVLFEDVLVKFMSQGLPSNDKIIVKLTDIQKLYSCTAMFASTIHGWTSFVIVLKWLRWSGCQSKITQIHVWGDKIMLQGVHHHHRLAAADDLGGY